MKKRKGMLLLLGVLLGCLVSGCGNKQSETSADEVKVGSVNSAVSVHDPSILKDENGMYYIFGSHMEAAKSEDLVSWTSFASGVNPSNPLFDNLFDESMDAFSFVGKNEEGSYSVWAPDVIYNNVMGKYVMYFCTTSSYMKSSLCFAVADQPEGPYTYVDRILDSGFTQDEMTETDIFAYIGEEDTLTYINGGVYNNQKWPNCIDPTVFYDADGKMWMVYGSWSGGIFLLEIDESTGYPIHPEGDEDQQIDPYYGKKLLGGGHKSIEAPYILYDETSGYYYLFVSYGNLQAEGGYQIRQFRSKQVDGPYEDMNGQTPDASVDHSWYGLKMMGNYTFPSLNVTYMAPGHNSALMDIDGKLYVVYHQRYQNKGELHNPRVHQMFRTEDGWLTAAPFNVNGEELSVQGYDAAEISGTYYLVDHGLDIDSKVHECQEIILKKNGTITGDIEGSFTVDEEQPYITLTIEDKEYHGVLLQMTDEAGNDTMCISAVGNNRTLWGVHYR